MIDTASLELKDYTYDMRRCMRCASCKWMDHIYLSDNRFVYRCPSYGRYYFSKVAYGRLKLGLALVEGRIEDTPAMMDMVFQCLLCGACDAGCKRNLDLEILSALEALRGHLVQQGRFPEAHKRLVNHILTDHNRFGAPHRDRDSWPAPHAAAASDTVYFAGCAASYVEQGIAQAADRILQRLGGYMRLPGEICCGHPLFALGHYEAFREQMRQNLEAMAQSGARRLVTACAECYKTWKVDYPRFLRKGTSELPFEVLHISELLAEGLVNGTLHVNGRADLKVAWHDPCNLGRMSEPYRHWEGTRGQWGCLQPAEGFPLKEFRRGTEGVYAAPREVLSRIPGLEMVELKRHHDFAWCCGGHGGVPEAYPDLKAYTVRERLEEATVVGAEAVVSACPYCKRTFKEGVRELGIPLEIWDIAELAARVL